LVILAGVAVMLLAVVFASLAGFGRDRQLRKSQRTSGSFLGGLIMTVIAGITSAGLWLAFIYCQGPIQSRVSMVEAGEKIDVTVAADDRLCEAFQVGRDGKVALRRDARDEAARIDDNQKKKAGKEIAQALSGRYAVAADGSISLKNAAENGAAIAGLAPVKVGGMNAKDASERVAGALGLSKDLIAEKKVTVGTMSVLTILPVWAAGAFSGAVLNLVYPMILMTRRRSWGVLFGSWKEFGLAIIIGVQFFLALVLPGKGMIMLGTLGAAVGAGIQQAMQMVGGQGTGFISGEWRGVRGAPRLQMYASIALLIMAAAVMAISQRLK
jgi:hypothetical protein